MFRRYGMKMEIIDNFLEEEDFLSLCDLTKSLSPSFERETPFYLTKHKHGHAHKIASQHYVNNLVAKYQERLKKILDELAPHKSDLISYTQLQLQSTPPSFAYPPHLDSTAKLLSGVVYLLPSRSTGTLIHKSRYDKVGKEMPWSQNRALFFSRTPSKSWHSYKGDGKAMRWVFVMNLITEREDEHEQRDMSKIQYSLLKTKKKVWNKLRG